MNPAFTDVLTGWSTGFAYANYDKQEAEYSQGKNAYFAALTQINLTAHLGVVVSKINETLVPPPWRFPVNLCRNLIQVLSVPVFIYSASVKQRDNEELAHWFNERPHGWIRLPEKLSSKSISLFTFISENSGTILRAAMFVSALALLILRNVVFGAAILAALSYDMVDRMGLVPRRISLFMEIYMPNISSLGLLIGGTAIIRVIYGVILSTYVFPQFGTYIHHRVDSIFRHYFEIEGISLEEIDAPLEEKKEMTFDEINQILEHTLEDFSINPPHCSQLLVDIAKLQKDDDFEKIMQLFDQIDWEKKYDVLVEGKLKDDDRFIDLLASKFPEKNADDLINDFDSLIGELAVQEGISRERFAASWMRDQLKGFVEVLQEKKPAKGLQQDLDEAIRDSAILVPLISSVQDPILQEDALAKLAIEGGNYCARGVRRAANEVLYSILRKEVQDTEDLVDTVKNYELQVLLAMQNRRFILVEKQYQPIAKSFLPDRLSQDTHFLDSYRLFSSLGFYPLTPYERRLIGLKEIFIWECYNHYLIKMYQDYLLQLDDVVKEVGNVNFGIYLNQMIQSNMQLTQAQKDELLEKFINKNNGQWTLEETNQKFHLLLFVRLGIIKPSLEVYI